MTARPVPITSLPLVTMDLDTSAALAPQAVTAP
jgi:hypothetical protein